MRIYKTESEYQEMLHARSVMNRGACLDSSECGCFFCLHIFKSDMIDRWIDDESTAICPYCAVDAVMPQSDDYELDDALLLRMKEYWF